jgi:NDP-sugar pyrophosphorylase family protein
MQTVVLVGGLGTRLGALTNGKGKPMVAIAGRPFLELLIRHLAREGLVDLVLCVGHRGEHIMRSLGDGHQLGVRIQYSEEDRPLGTAGALRRASSLLSRSTFLVSNGDSMIDFSSHDLLEAHEASGATVTMTVARTLDASRFGLVTMDADGHITGFLEKPSSPGGGLVNAGLYMCEPQLLDSLPERVPASLEHDVLPELLGDGLNGYVARGELVDIGTPDSLESARRDPSYLLALSGVGGD